MAKAKKDVREKKKAEIKKKKRAKLKVAKKKKKTKVEITKKKKRIEAKVMAWKKIEDKITRNIRMFLEKKQTSKYKATLSNNFITKKKK